jgi:V/A-type H+-transporting ATPase subunit I
MAVEKMRVIGIIGKRELINKVLRLIVFNGNLHVINAITLLDSSNFMLPTNEENIQFLEELPYMGPFPLNRNLASDESTISSLVHLFNLKPHINEGHLGQDYDYDDFMAHIYDIHKEVISTSDRINEIQKEVELNKMYIANMEYLAQYKFDIQKLFGMDYFTVKLIRISKDNYIKLKKNYENIPAIILKVGIEGNNVILLSIAPDNLKETVEKILRPLNYTTLEIPDGYTGLPVNIIDELNERISKAEDNIALLKKSIDGFISKYGEDVEKAYSRIAMEKKIEALKINMVASNKLFFILGFVPYSELESLKNQIKSNFKDNVLILDEGLNEHISNIKPPTKLNNISLFRPFESLVKMYGIPSYDEKDPTVFFGITYMILFGLMFGDIGQGAVLLTGGLFLERVMKRTGLGGVLARIGFSSVIFGFFYGSVFGSEELFPALIIKPMANINLMLVIALIIGVFLSISAFIYNVLNSRIQGDIEEGLFGKHGVVGLAFYLLLLYTIYGIALSEGGISQYIIYAMVGLLGLMVLKQPISNKLSGAERLYNTSPADYFVEEGFGLVETLLSMLSNTISFLRIGAFALNHVGLFLAFATMGRMMNSKVGNLFTLILGNIIIIGLEGLIVFIQALRLEYYEMFSKYYKGDGLEYAPAKLK